MTILSGTDIRDRLNEKDEDLRLVVAPLLEPAEQLRPDQASIDIRLGFSFSLVQATEKPYVDELDQRTDSSHSAASELFKELYAPFGQPIYVHPHQFLLATTLEYLRLPYDLASYVVGRSTLGRLGLIVATAVGIHPGYTGSLTLELRNLGEAPIAMYPGQTIGQLFFHKVSGANRDSEQSGQYQASVASNPKSISTGMSRRVLEELKTQRSSNGLQKK